MSPQEASSARSSTTQSDDECFEEGTSWEPIDMQNLGMTVENDAVACQRRCLGVPGCIHFSFLKATQNCHLQDAFAMHQPSSIGFVSGPFSCQGIRPGQEAYVNFEHETFLPRDLGCLQTGTDYMNDLGATSIFSPVQDADHGIMGLNTIRNCQRQCSETKGCEHFSVQFPMGTCKLASASAMSTTNIAGAVSGTRAGCNVASTVATDAAEGIMVKDTVGMHALRQAGGTGGIVLVALSVLATIIAVSVRLQRRSYSRLEEESPAEICEPSQDTHLQDSSASICQEFPLFMV
jgi:hypothetical protein